MDLGSLNGTMLNGTSISTPDRTQGQAHALSDGDKLELGEVTRIKVSCGPSHPAKRQAVAATWGHGARNPAADRQHHPFTLTSGAKLPQPQTVQEFSEQGLRLVVHQRQGTEHLRTGRATEDVPLHVCPFAAFGAGASLFCVFDGHSGSQAAVQARDLVPGLIEAKLKPDAEGRLITGRSRVRQAQLLTEVFLDADKRITSDEGCTASVVLMENGPEKQLFVQVGLCPSETVAVTVLTSLPQLAN